MNDDTHTSPHSDHNQRQPRVPSRGAAGRPRRHERAGQTDRAQAGAGHPPRHPRPHPRRGTPHDIAPRDVDILLAEAASGAPPDLADPRVVNRILRQHNLRPKKGFGQHLLVDRSALDALVDAAALTPDDSVLEVGAGMGVLTQALAERARRVVAVELEREILPILRETTARFTNVEIIPRNLLEVQPEEVFGQDPYKLVANLPYYITAPTLRHFLEAANRPTLVVIMVQKEVAQRLVAAPGDLSLLGLSVQFYGRPQLIRTVSADSFYPPPQVDSAIVRVDIYPEPPLDPATRDLLFGIAHAGFAERRKQLHNTLARNLKRPRDTIAAWLDAAGIDPSRRAETLSVEDWLRLTRAAQTVSGAHDGA